MPGLFWLYTGSNIETPVLQMMISILKIIILPVTLGIILNSLNLKFINKINSGLPLIAVIAIIIIIATIIGSSANHILIYGWSILLIVISGLLSVVLRAKNDEAYNNVDFNLCTLSSPCSLSY